MINGVYLCMYVRMRQRRQRYSNPLVRNQCWIGGRCIPHVFPNWSRKEGCRVLEVRWVTSTKPWRKSVTERHGAGRTETCAMLNIAGLNYTYAPKNEVFHRHGISANAAFWNLEFCPRSTEGFRRLGTSEGLLARCVFFFLFHRLVEICSVTSLVKAILQRIYSQTYFQEK